MRYAIVSDIHANLQAWQAVLKDIEKKGVDAILCLGDVIGYGPDPAQVLDSCYENCSQFILGNHDAVIGGRLDSNLFNDNAKYIIEWTRTQLTDQAEEFFRTMPLRMEGVGFVCAHAELETPGRFAYIYDNEQAYLNFASTPEQFMFIGHTHVPTKFTLDIRSDKITNVMPENTPAEKYMRYLINVGSVGDPRDGKTTASYVIFDQEKREAIFRNVAFDVAEYRDRLNEVALPTKPFFISIFDGIEREIETIKDMRLITGEIVAATKTKSFYVNKESIKESKSTKLNLSFTPDEIQSYQKMMEELDAQSSDTEINNKSEIKSKPPEEIEKIIQKKKLENKLILILSVLLIIGVAIYLYMKFKSP